MRKFLRPFIASAALLLPALLWGQDADTLATRQLEGLTVTARRSGTSRVAGALNGVKINREELFKAACCNLGESFTTNPSVDVSYSDAATGAEQIRLLGLSGVYVQMLSENLPDFRGAAMPYALGYVPGPWMNSIQVSKGASSVRNGYESITGQIDIEYLKPEDDEGVAVNVYGDQNSRLEANVDANFHLTGRLNTEVLAHYENQWGHSDENGDGFLDDPMVRQVHLQNRWDWLGQRYIFHGGLDILDERRDGGQTHRTSPGSGRLYQIRLDTRRYGAYMKHAFMLDTDHGTNIALMATATLHQLDAGYGDKAYDVDESNAYAQLMFETNLTMEHNLSVGLSLNHDNLRQHCRMVPVPAMALTRLNEHETTPGAYAQYTLNLDDRLVLMAGIRADHSSRYGTFVTPRLHLKLTPVEAVSLRLSVGKGYRSPHVLAENNYLLASGRTLYIGDITQERAWNYGVSSSFYIPLLGQTLKLNAEYYYTRFSRQMLTDFDSAPATVMLTALQGKSYSHTYQVDASYPVLPGLELTAAYRRNNVRATYGGRLLEKPLTSRYKGLVTASYKTPLGLWQLDATFQMNGGGRMPTPYTEADGTPSWDERFPAYGQLNAQVTRWFRHFSVYVGGENLTGYTLSSPIIHAEDPWSAAFDPTMVWGPVSGAMLYVGIRLNFGKRL